MRRRLRALVAQLPLAAPGPARARGCSAAAAAAVDVQLVNPVIVAEGGRDKEAVGLLTDDQMRAFVRNGIVAVQLDDIDPELHRRFYETAMALDSQNSNSGTNSHNADTRQSVGADLEEGMNAVFRSSKFRGALRSVLGPDFMIGNNWKDDGAIGYSYRMHVSAEGQDQGARGHPTTCPI